MSKVYGNIGEKVSGWYKTAANFFIKYDVAVNTSDEGPLLVEFSLRQPVQMVSPMEQGRLK